MENLIKRMQDQVSGIAVKPQKLFLTIISNAFTGESLIIWMIKNLDIEDTGKISPRYFLKKNVYLFVCY